MSTLQPGQIFAGYTVERQLGAGGMGEVYLARHPRLPRHDALKVLAVGLAEDSAFRARFEREADLVADLHHPSIVSVYDRGETDGRLWIALRYVDGPDLAAVAHRGPMPLEQVDRVITEIADALDTAGAHDLVHRDVKPANILLDKDGRALLTDFGIAHDGSDVAGLTGTGVTVGTVAYSSPEQLQALPVDPRSDQYSLACTAFTLLTGTLPYTGASSTAIILAHIRDAIPRVSDRRPGMPPALDDVFIRALAKDPGHRYPTSRDFAAALHRALASTALPLSEQATLAQSTPPPAAVPTAVGRAPQPPFSPDPMPAGRPVRRSRKALIAAIVAVVVVLLVAGGTMFVLRDSGDGPVTAADLQRDPVSPDTASLERRPAQALWSFDSQHKYDGAEIVGGTEKYTLVAQLDLAPGTKDRTLLHVLDAETGKTVRTIRFPGSDRGIEQCQNFQTAGHVVCEVGLLTNEFATIDLDSGKVDRIVVAHGDDGVTELGVSGDTAWVNTRGRDDDAGIFTAFDMNGRKLWSTDAAANSRLAAGSPVVSEVDGSVFRLRDVTTGATVYTRDVATASDPDAAAAVQWSPFRDGFAITVDEADPPPGKHVGPGTVELHDRTGKRTAVVDENWSMIIATSRPIPAPPLPVLTNSRTSETATFDPATGKPVVTVHLESEAQFVEGIVGTKIAVAYRSEKASKANSSDSGVAVAWFDAYQDTTGSFVAANADVVGTDGTRLLVLDEDSLVAYGPGSGDALWFLTVEETYRVIVAGGKVYDGLRRLL